MIRRGDVYFADLDPVVGREQAGRRPVLVVSDDSVNRRGLVVTVIVGTDARKVDRDYSTNVRVPSRESGLPRDTVFLCFQVRSLDLARLVDPARGVPHRVGRVVGGRMKQVEAAIRLVLGL